MVRAQDRMILLGQPYFASVAVANIWHLVAYSPPYLCRMTLLGRRILSIPHVTSTCNGCSRTAIAEPERIKDVPIGYEYPNVRLDQREYSTRKTTVGPRCGQLS